MPGWKLLVGFRLIRFKRVASDLEKNIYYTCHPVWCLLLHRKISIECTENSDAL